MSSAKSKKNNRRELLKRLGDLGRKISTQTVFLHQAIAQSVGLNATDTKCIDLVLRQRDDVPAPMASWQAQIAKWVRIYDSVANGITKHGTDRRQMSFVVHCPRSRRRPIHRAQLYALEVIGKPLHTLSIVLVS